jgi:hypothetical protein
VGTSNDERDSPSVDSPDTPLELEEQRKREAKVLQVRVLACHSYSLIFLLTVRVLLSSFMLFSYLLYAHFIALATSEFKRFAGLFPRLYMNPSIINTFVITSRYASMFKDTINKTITVITTTITSITILGVGAA